MGWPGCGPPARKSCACGRSRTDRAQPMPSSTTHPASAHKGDKEMMKLLALASRRATAVTLVAAAMAALASLPDAAQAQAKEQFFPLLVYRTGPYAPNGTPWANGKQDYIKLINARDGGINGVKISYEECETGYATDKGVEC